MQNVGRGLIAALACWPHAAEAARPRRRPGLHEAAGQEAGGGRHRQQLLVSRSLPAVVRSMKQSRHHHNHHASSLGLEAASGSSLSEVNASAVGAAAAGGGYGGGRLHVSASRAMAGSTAKGSHLPFAYDELGFGTAIAMFACLACAFVAVVAFNVQSEQVRARSAKIGLQSFSVLMGSLLQMVPVRLLHGIFSDSAGFVHPIWQMLSSALLCLVSLSWYVGLSELCWRCRRWPDALAAIHGVASYAVAFLAIAILSDQQEFVIGLVTKHYWPKDKGKAPSRGDLLACYGCYDLIAMGILRLMSVRCEKYRYTKPQEKGESKLWLEVAEDCELQVSSVLVGQLLAKSLWFTWTGKSVSDPSVSQRDTLWLGFLISLLFWMAMKWQRGIWKADPRFAKLFDYLEAHCLLALSWLWLTIFRHDAHLHLQKGWPKYDKSVLVDKSATAFLCMLVLACGILLMKRLGDRHLFTERMISHITTAVGLAVGVVWAEALSTCLGVIASAGDFLQVFYALVLLGSIFPFWLQTLLPRSVEAPPAKADLEFFAPQPRGGRVWMALSLALLAEREAAAEASSLTSQHARQKVARRGREGYSQEDDADDAALSAKPSREFAARQPSASGNPSESASEDERESRSFF
eukprot:TRINITY_DN38229_c0_g1_i1.p1 TRINITY_DN38229_c0_g1~~TRINITY_DN38229_c0_g1_i1.p1  ORF type:complete len:635 (-),score=139.64 TRINITY_DN38229_c0_g1_i1:87-1991(-)